MRISARLMHRRSFSLQDGRRRLFCGRPVQLKLRVWNLQNRLKHEVRTVIGLISAWCLQKMLIESLSQICFPCFTTNYLHHIKGTFLGLENLSTVLMTIKIPGCIFLTWRVNKLSRMMAWPCELISYMCKWITASLKRSMFSPQLPPATQHHTAPGWFGGRTLKVYSYPRPLFY